MSRGCKEGVKSCEEGVKSCEEGVKSCQEGGMRVTVSRRCQRVVKILPRLSQKSTVQRGSRCQQDST